MKIDIADLNSYTWDLQWDIWISWKDKDGKTYATIFTKNEYLPEDRALEELWEMRKSFQEKWIQEVELKLL